MRYVEENERMTIIGLSIRPAIDRYYCTIARPNVARGGTDKGEVLNYAGSKYSEVSDSLTTGNPAGLRRWWCWVGRRHVERVKSGRDEFTERLVLALALGWAEAGKQAGEQADRPSNDQERNTHGQLPLAKRRERCGGKDCNGLFGNLINHFWPSTKPPAKPRQK